MLSYMDRINDTASLHPVPKIEMKKDNSPVTELDLALSQLVEEIQKAHFSDHIFYSEENFSEWGFPLLALDPLDGTREYIDGRPEWAMSLGLFQDAQFKGEGWVYNPKSGECFSEAEPRPFSDKDQFQGEVSRSEWKSGLFTNYESTKFQIKPMGSIAYKLGRLSQGKIDFVVSLWPKSIWDIAGGTLLCQAAGLKFYAGGKLVTKVEKKYQPPLIWCREEIFSELSSAFA